MKNKKMIFVAATVIAISATSYGMYWFGKNQGMKMTAPIASASQPSGANGQNADKKVLYWHDPMVPAQKFDKPGKSPFMDMPLVPVYADAGGDEGTVNISPRVQQNLGIRTAEVTKGKLASVVVAVGSVAYNERDVALVQARSNGFVERLYVRAPLDPVKKGQALAELYVPEWVAAQEEYLSVKRMQGSGAGDSLALLRSGARQRMRLVGMSDAQIRLVERSGKLHPRLTITAPIGGVISELNVRDGMTVMTGAPLFRINGLDTIWINAAVPENLAAQVRPGNAVEATTPSLPGTVFKGKVSAILPEVNAATRTLKARVELANPSGQLVPGMFATLNFNSAPSADILLVPTEAVIKTGTRSVVMTALGDGKFIPVDVVIGTETNGQTEIRKGLEEGQNVVVSGQFLIDSEASLRGTTTRMSGMAAPDSNQDAGPTHRAEGRVERIEQDEITISHGPIPSLEWGAMTMGFNVPASGLPKNVAVGDNVVFEIRAAKDGMFEIASITPKPSKPAAAAMDSGMKMPAGAAR